VVLAAAPAQDDAVAEEAHQAAVVHARHDGDLSQEVSLPDRLVAGDPLDGHRPAVVEEASVDFGGAAATHHGTEVSGDDSDLVVSELPWQLLDVDRGLLHLNLRGSTTTPCRPRSFELFSQINTYPVAFFSHNKPANSTFSHNKLAKRTD
jgi:hypothetical protein